MKDQVNVHVIQNSMDLVVDALPGHMNVLADSVTYINNLLLVTDRCKSTWGMLQRPVPSPRLELRFYFPSDRLDHSHQLDVCLA